MVSSVNHQLISRADAHALRHVPSGVLMHLQKRRRPREHLPTRAIHKATVRPIGQVLEHERYLYCASGVRRRFRD